MERPNLGHSVTTYSQVFCGIVKTPRGPLLRIYEFDRLLETTWQVDAFLPEDSSNLWVHIKVINPSEQAVNFYWWTNIAVTLTPKTRVLSPADLAISHLPAGITQVPFPLAYGNDGSYPQNYDHSDSIFF